MANGDFNGAFVLRQHFEFDDEDVKTGERFTLMFTYEVPASLVNGTQIVHTPIHDSEGNFNIGADLEVKLQTEIPGIAVALDAGDVVFQVVEMPVALDSTGPQLLAAAETLWNGLRDELVDRFTNVHKYTGQWVKFIPA